MNRLKPVKILAFVLIVARKLKSVSFVIAIAEMIMIGGLRVLDTNKQAAEQERSGNYVDALFLWDKALYEASDPKQ